MLKKNEIIKDCLLYYIILFFNYIFFYLFYFIDKVEHIYPRGGGGEVYRVREQKTNKIFILKGSSIAVSQDKTNINNNNNNNQNSVEDDKQKKKQKIEELIKLWQKKHKKKQTVL
jgi:hypothetical protein